MPVYPGALPITPFIVHELFRLDSRIAEDSVRMATAIFSLAV